MKTTIGQQKSIRRNLSLWLIIADLRRGSAAASLLKLRVRIRAETLIIIIYLTASGLSPGGSGYFTFKLRQTY
jgi:hypothetical protein